MLKTWPEALKQTKTDDVGTVIIQETSLGNSSVDKYEYWLVNETWGI